MNDDRFGCSLTVPITVLLAVVALAVVGFVTWIATR